MRDRRGQLNMPHPLPANLRLNHLDTTLIADNPAMLHALILPAITLPILGRTEDLGAEQPVFFWFKRPIVDRLRLLDLTVGPGPDFFRRRNANAHRIKGYRIPLFFEQCVYAFQGSDLL